MDGLDEEAVRSLELGDDSFGQVHKAEAWILIADVLEELRNTLSVGFCLELRALAKQQCPKLLVIGHDAIVDHGEFPSGI